MTLEAITLWGVIKTLIGFFGAFVLYVTKSNYSKLQDTYSRKETDSLIDLKIAPLEQKIDSNAKGLEDKFDILMEIVKADNANIREDNALHAIQRKENHTMLQAISTDVAVIRNDVDNLKERIDDR
mgnify:CR=1 FL=1